VSKDLQASIIINNYNYGRFLAEAIDSALSQTYPNTEVIVVDDGSTDNSREIIASYGDKIIAVLKENAGQTSTFNAGFPAARGEIICFLDSDDVLLPAVLEQAASFFTNTNLIKVHWSLWIVDAHSRKTGALKPPHTIPEGDLLDLVIRDGPDSAVWSPTSGNAWSRQFLEKVFPLPEVEKEFGVGSASADAYLSMLAPLFGHIKRIEEPQGFYRLHGQNDHSAMSFDKKLKRDLQLFDHRSAILSKYCQEMGVNVEPDKWKENSWFYRLHLATEEIAKLIGQKTFILVDDDAWMMDDSDNRSVIPFLERNGQYWGAPSDNETAIRELERLRQSGANFLVFAWTAFWWLDFYSEFHYYLRTKFSCVLENERLVIFDLRAEL
jgi:glycosyltransferase involved in cell wall biosynthesis